MLHHVHVYANRYMYGPISVWIYIHTTEIMDLTKKVLIEDRTIQCMMHGYHDYVTRDKRVLSSHPDLGSLAAPDP